MTGPSRRVYAQCGLRFRSELELSLPQVGDTEWDVDVRWGEPLAVDSPPRPGRLVARYGSDHDPWYSAVEDNQGYCLRFRDTGELWISPDLDEIVVRPDRRGHVELLPVLVAGTATAFVLTLRGTTVLHASAVAVDGRVIAFVGQSGRGKSTLAALMCTAGASLVTDDVLAVDPGPPAVGTGGVRELRLRDNAKDLVEGRADVVTRVTADGRLAYAPARVASGPLPLATVVVPTPAREIAAVETRRLEPATAVTALLSFPRVHGWTDTDVLQRDFATIGRLVNELPVHAAIIPWGPPFDPAIADVLGSLANPR